MTPLLDALHRWIGGYIPPTPDLIPGEVRMHPADLNDVVREVGTRSSYDGKPAPSLLGLTLTRDQAIPAGVWRVCAHDGRLIHDSRSGRTS